MVLTKSDRSIKISMIVLATILTIALGDCLEGGGGTIPPEVADNASDWPLPNKDYENTRATVDSEISSENVVNLTTAWSFPIPGIGALRRCCEQSHHNGR